jgi:hypothetical protein
MAAPRASERGIAQPPRRSGPAFWEGLGAGPFTISGKTQGG